jgi:hypothetical protein
MVVIKKIRMSFTPETISIQVPDKGFSITEPNLIMYEQNTNFILGIGKSQEEVLKDYQVKKQDFPNGVCFTPVFNLESKGIDWELEVLVYYSTRSLMELYKFPYPPSIVWYDYDLWIANYEKWEEEKKQLFEYQLQRTYNAHILKINGREVSLPFSKRKLADYSWNLVQALPLFILYITMLVMALQQQSWLGLLVIGIIVASLTWAVCTLVWLTLCTKNYLLSATYLKYYLPDLGKGLLFQRVFYNMVDRAMGS